MQTNFRLRFYWGLLIGSISVLSVVPRVTLHHPLLAAYVNSDWIHFAAYASVSAFSLLAWRLRTGIAISLGVAILSMSLQIVRAIFAGHATDVDGTVINLLGIAAGILLGLHLHRFRSNDGKGSLGPKSERAR